ncbi:Uncharacterized protein dnl_09070 [Desulfonema limicola]|uniref:Uncharacterized protein n=1 Tax=Desulfonema limicola TaxID=45656 RepID=A0A975B4K8_9BACT|nr:hypothetical protein [Desulfonema limicola]QTA78678.1 Uncharacterized protein dnl_09070 [Desulfonema limicola]
MAKKRMGLQIKFNPENEKDLIEFFSGLKKTEVHVTAISAFRMYMRSVGFYDRCRSGGLSFSSDSSSDSSMEEISIKKETIADDTELTEESEEGIVDEEAFEQLGSLFDKENEV